MMYSEWLGWIKRNKPVGMAENDFRDFLGLVGAITIQQNIEKQDLTIDELIHKLFNAQTH